MTRFWRFSDLRDANGKVVTLLSEEEGCNCGCGKDRRTVVLEIARHEMLNYEQAESRLEAANKARKELGLAK